MSGTIRTTTYMMGTQWVDSGTAGRDTPSSVRDTIESLLADLQTTQPVNLHANPLSNGAVVGSSGGGAGTLSGTLPTGVSVGFGQGNLVLYVAAIGLTAGGMPYWDLNVSGTTSTTLFGVNFSPSPTGGVAITATSGYTFNLQIALSAGALTNITSELLDVTYNNVSGTYVNDNATAATPTGTLANFTNAQTAGATSVWAIPSFLLSFSSGVAINARFRFAYPQVLLTSSSAAYTALIGDRGETTKINSPVGFTVTIPNGVFSAGQVVSYRQWGAGQITVQGDGTSILVSSSTTYTTRAQGSKIVITADWDVANLFWVDGDLT